MSVANKNNFGYISPEDFNLYAKQAQLDIFEDYFYQYNNWILKQNDRLSGRVTSGSSYADIVRYIETIIDTFSSTVSLVYDTGSFILPTDYYYLNTIRYNNAKEVDRVSQSKVLNLLASNLTSPSTLYPAYTLEDNLITVYPSTIITNIKAQYIRVPKDPKWTYLELTGGEPVFDQSASDYQDFELPATDEPLLVNKILQYAGMSIREGDIYTFGSQDEMKEQQQQG